MAKAKSSNLALIRGPRRYLEGTYLEVPPTFVYHYTFKQVGNTVFVANAALPIQLTPKLTLSQLVAKFPNKTLDDLILENAKSKSGWTRATPEQAEQYRKIKAQHDAYCLKAFAQRAKAAKVTKRKTEEVDPELVKSVALALKESYWKPVGQSLSKSMTRQIELALAGQPNSFDDALKSVFPGIGESAEELEVQPIYLALALAGYEDEEELMTEEQAERFEAAIEVATEDEDDGEEDDE